jgi:hypothetical protein
MKNLLNYIYDYSKRSLVLQVVISLLVLHLVLLASLLLAIAIDLYGKYVFMVIVISILTFFVWQLLYGIDKKYDERR